ncbi:polysaccharide deacetylase family protein [Fodinicola acaciae]|uniref:polysaccharide deacetylase family protein n=1 Tax=Fodinicola acaciae TaxID=2681555 RepID=UPI0013D06265|nr:polysaccharide deacetylase family protein [Fodinicola acaciae]
MAKSRVVLVVVASICAITAACATPPPRPRAIAGRGMPNVHVVEPHVAPIRPKDAAECRVYDPTGRTPRYTRIPDVPSFPPPPRPDVQEVHGTTSWLGLGRPPRRPGSAIVVDRIPTRQKVVFLTIDDGSDRDPRTDALLRKAKVPVTVFLVGTVQRCETPYFRGMQRLGARMENHTEFHPLMPRRGLTGQRREICGPQPRFQKAFGHRPQLFRPPYGMFNADTLTAMSDCKVHYLVLWTVSVHDRRTIGYPHRRSHTLEPGDIILMHFQNDFVESYATVLKLVKEAGLTPALLEDYLQ